MTDHPVRYAGRGFFITESKHLPVHFLCKKVFNYSLNCMLYVDSLR